MQESNGKLKVFIHTNAKQYLGAVVSAYSMKSRSKHPDRFDVEILRLEDFHELTHRQGRPYLREGKRVIWDNDDLQSFTPTRFLPPQLLGYQGRALVTDPDVFAVGDVYDLLTRDMEGKAILCRRIFPKKEGVAPYYASSVMLLDCSKLTHWKWEDAIGEMFSYRRDYRQWMSLELEKPETIGLLEEEWNHFDVLNERTKLLHNTGRITQPWKTGLPIDFTPKQPPTQEKKWGVIPRPWIGRARALIKGTEYSEKGFYRQHPDPKQENFFYSLVKECLDKGILRQSDLDTAIQHRHIRKDSFEVLQRLERKGTNEVRF